MFLGSRAGLNISANAAGYQGTLPEQFVMAGHSAGGGFATAVAGDYIADLGPDPTDNQLLGVVMFDGVSSSTADFAESIASLDTLNIPDYTVAAPSQAWNAFGTTTNELVELRPGQFVGVELVGGSHVDSMLGVNPLLDFVLQLVTGFSRAATQRPRTPCRQDGSTISTSDRDRPIRHTASTVPPVIRSFWGSRWNCVAGVAEFSCTAT